AHQVGDELAALLRERRRVLDPERRREEHQLRTLTERVEEAVGGEVDLALAPAGRDPADRPRCDQRLERVVRQAVIVLRCVVEHARLYSFRRAAANRWARAK